MNIKIISNILHDDLYKISKSFFESIPYEKITVSGKSGFYNFNFLNHIIINKEYDLDIAVFIDEDCFIINNKEFIALIEYVVDNDIDCVGMPDGGVSRTRIHNPLVINPFFCILNIQKIRKKYNFNDIQNSYFTNDLKQYTPFHLMKDLYNYTKNREPYYNLFFWLIKNKFKFLYLDAYNFEDKITTILKNHKNIDFAYHTWEARNWPNDRINKIIDHCLNINK